MAAAAAEDDAADAGPVPLLVQLLAGNPATAPAIIFCLNAADTCALRQLHPVVAAVVAAVPWLDTHTTVYDVVRWRAALPAAVGARLTHEDREGSWFKDGRELKVAALAGVTHLNLYRCWYLLEQLLACLPPSLRVLSIRKCENLMASASFTHLPALVSLDCSLTKALCIRADGLPPSLQELDMSWMQHELGVGLSLAHLTQLRVLHATHSSIDDAFVASLPPGLVELQANWCCNLGQETSFAHLSALVTLNLAHAYIGDATLASMPPSLVRLDLRECSKITPAATLPHLPGLRVLDVSGTAIGDALLASLPAGLAEFRITICPNVTPDATLEHVPALRVLHSVDTALAPGMLAACRARGCTVPAAGKLSEHRGFVTSLALLGDGRLASGDKSGEVRVWDVAHDGGTATVVLHTGSGGAVAALATLPDGHRLAAAVAASVEVWDVDAVPPVLCLTIECGAVVRALAVLRDGSLAAGCADGNVRVVDLGAGAVAAVLVAHVGPEGTYRYQAMMALAVLPDGTLVSGTDDANNRKVWDVSTRACVATLEEADGVPYWCSADPCHLAVLTDGRLVTTAKQCKVQLWDVAARACVGVLAGHRHNLSALAALPDGRLVTACDQGAIRLWDTRTAASRPAPVVLLAEVLYGGLQRYKSTHHGPVALQLLPDGRLACASGGADGPLHLLHLPPPTAYE